ncbi:RabGAP/TBC [Auricularia subglabra TFB-10046 SS5]|nr:RabGAP/TBC [Auricularia subglabra TFB-10046 SS5]
MTAPPARPHIIAAPRHHSFNTSCPADEDDAWDTGSDKEDGRPTQPVKPRAPTRQSTNGLAFSFTYVSPPSPSSYAGPVSPLQQQQPAGGSPNQSRAKSSWTIVRKQSDDKTSQRSRDSPASHADVDVEDMIIPGDELDQHDHSDQQPFASRSTPIIKPHAEDIVNDPFRIVGGSTGAMRKGAESAPMSLQPSDNAIASATSRTRDRSIRSARKRKILDCLLAEHVNLANLRKVVSSGIPDDVRLVAWQLLLGYLPLARAAQAAALARKREEYASLVCLTFARDSDSEQLDPAALPASVISAVEADTFWCLSRLLDGIQDNYISAQR